MLSNENYEQRNNFEIDLDRIILKLRGAQIILIVTIDGKDCFCRSIHITYSKDFWYLKGDADLKMENHYIM